MSFERQYYCLNLFCFRWKQLYCITMAFLLLLHSKRNISLFICCIANQNHCAGLENITLMLEDTSMPQHQQFFCGNLHWHERSRSWRIVQLWSFLTKSYTKWTLHPCLDRQRPRFPVIVVNNTLFIMSMRQWRNLQCVTMTYSTPSPPKKIKNKNKMNNNNFGLGNWIASVLL